jgi:hypothetical protein
MSPRKLLGAVPAAFTAETLSGLTANQFVRTDATSTIASSSAQTLLTLNQNGAGNILDLKAGNISLASFLASGNVGIGTSSPYAKLSVAGQVVAAYFTGTSTATSTFGGGLNLTSGCYAMGGTCLATSSGITTLNGLSTLAQSFATSSDANMSLTIVSSGATHTFTPSWVGTLSVARGGTGTSTAPSFGQLLIGSGTGYDLRSTSSLGIALSDTLGTLAANRGGTGLSTIASSSLLIGGAGNTILQVSTSSLGLPSFTDLTSYLSLAQWFATTTTALQEGNNLYFTNTRADARINATDTLGTLLFLPNLSRSTTTNATTTNFAVTGNSTSTFGGGLNITSGCYAVNGVCLTTSTGASSTLLADANTFTGANNFTNILRSTTTAATSTSFFASILSATLATFTNLFGTNATITNATSTNLSTTNLVATNGTFAGATTSALAVTGSATSTFGGGVNVTSGCLAQNGICIATSSGITTLNGLSSLSQSFATGTDANLNLVITSAGATHTFTPSWVGTLSIARGGTGTSTIPSYGQLLVGSGTGYDLRSTSSLAIALADTTGILAATRGGTGLSVIASSSLLIGGAGNTILQFATSSLGLPTFTDLTSYLSLASWFATTTNGLAEGGNNLYYTNARADARINATNTLGTLFFLPSLVRSTTTNATATNMFATNFVASGATTTALSVSGNSTSTFGNGLSVAGGCFAINGVCLTDSSASSTLFSDANTFAGVNQFNRLTVYN